MEHMLHHNLLRNRYPPDMIPFINDVLLPQLRLEIQAKIIDVAAEELKSFAAEERKSEGGFKRSANKRSANKSMKCKKSRKTKSRRH